MKTYETGGTVIHIPNLGTSWRWVVSFMSQPLYSCWKIPQYLMIWGWVCLRAGLDVVAPARNQTSVVQLVAMYKIHFICLVVNVCW